MSRVAHGVACIALEFIALRAAATTTATATGRAPVGQAKVGAGALSASWKLHAKRSILLCAAEAAVGYLGYLGRHLVQWVRERPKT